jgi:hypothetical protein
VGCLFDAIVQPIFDFFARTTPWALFVRLAVLGALVVAYLVAEEAGALPWQ